MSLSAAVSAGKAEAAFTKLSQLDQAREIFKRIAPYYPELKKQLELLKTVVKRSAQVPPAGYSDGSITADNWVRIQDIAFGLETFLVSMTKE